MTALWGNQPYSFRVMSAIPRLSKQFLPPHVGTPPYSDRLMSGHRLTQTALCRATALLRPPYVGTPPYSDRPLSGHRLTQTASCRDTALLRPPCLGDPFCSSASPCSLIKYRRRQDVKLIVWVGNWLTPVHVHRHILKYMSWNKCGIIGER